MALRTATSSIRDAGSGLRSHRAKEALWGYLLIAPGILGVLAFTLLPVIAALGISFTKWTLLTPPEFVGMDNYRKLFTDATAAQVMKNTIYCRKDFTVVPLKK